MKIIFNASEHARIQECAKKAFPGKFIELDTCDFFLPDIEQGKIQMEGVDTVFYINTHYAYEDRMVNGNKTRYKILLTTINVKKDAYEVIYDSLGSCFVVCEEKDITFIPYEDFYQKIRPHIQTNA